MSRISQLQIGTTLLWGCAALALVCNGCATGGAADVQFNASRAGNGAIEESLTVKTAELHQFSEGDQPAQTTRRMTAQLQGAGPGTGLDPSGGATGDAYRIGAGDRLLLRSFDDESLNGPVSVRYDGYISLPLIPDVHVENATRAEATERLRQAYSAVFTDPRLSLSIVDVGSKSYFVMGDVAAPGEYPYTRPISLLDSVNLAGGPRINTRSGDSFVGSQGQLVQVFVIRHSDGMRNVYEYSLTGMTQQGPHDSDMPIYPSDIVYVPEGKNLVYVIGEIGRPDVFELTEGMTLLHLLTLAGGPVLSSSRLSNVVLMHEVDSTHTEIELVNVRKIFKTGQNPILAAGDIIYVPRKRVLRLSEFIGRLTGTVSPLLSLYNQAFDAYYADKRNRLLFGTSGQGTSPSAPDVFPLTVESVNSMLPASDTVE